MSSVTLTTGPEVQPSEQRNEGKVSTTVCATEQHLCGGSIGVPCLCSSGSSEQNILGSVVMILESETLMQFIETISRCYTIFNTTGEDDTTLREYSLYFLLKIIIASL